MNCNFSYNANEDKIYNLTSVNWGDV